MIHIIKHTPNKQHTFKFNKHKVYACIIKGFEYPNLKDKDPIEYYVIHKLSKYRDEEKYYFTPMDNSYNSYTDFNTGKECIEFTVINLALDNEIYVFDNQGQFFTWAKQISDKMNISFPSDFCTSVHLEKVYKSIERGAKQFKKAQERRRQMETMGTKYYKEIEE